MKLSEYLKFKTSGLCFLLLLLIGISLYPHLIGYINQKNTSYIYTYQNSIYPEESFYYLALGPSQFIKDNRLLAQDNFCRAPDQDLFINPIGNFIALVSNVFNLPITISFLIFRIIAACLLCITFYVFTGLFWGNIKTRIFATILYCFGAGFGTLYQPWNIKPWNTSPWNIRPWDSIAPEMNMFISMMGEYYIPLANALFIGIFISFWKLIHAKNYYYSILTGFLLLLLGAVYVYGMLIAMVIICCITMWYFFKKRKESLGIIKHTFVAILFSAPIIIYYLWVINIINSETLNEGWILAPNFISTIFTYGSFTLPAIFGLVIFRKSWISSEKVQFILIWIVLSLIITRIPQPYLPFQIQSYIGMAAPLAILATMFYDEMLRKFNIFKIRAITFLFVFTVLSISSTTNISIYNKFLKKLNDYPYPEFIPKEEYLALEWINKNVPKAKFLTTTNKTLILAGMTGCKVFFDVYQGADNNSSEYMNDFLLKWSSTIETSSDHQIINQLKEEGITHLFIEQEFYKNYLSERKLKILLRIIPAIYSRNNTYILELQ